MRINYSELEKANQILEQQTEICSQKLNNLLSNKINWIDVFDIHINFDHFLVHCDRVYFSFGRVSVADVQITKLYCALF